MPKTIFKAALAPLLMAISQRSLSQEATTRPTPAAADSAYVPTMMFDVASIRENKDIGGLGTGFIVGGGFVSQTATFRATNWDIQNLIGFAYDVERYQLVGIPKWPFPTMFSIEAKADSDTDAKISALTSDQQKLEREHMLQKLLEDRFKLKTHWDSKEGDVYNLVLACFASNIATAASWVSIATVRKQVRQMDSTLPSGL